MTDSGFRLKGSVVTTILLEIQTFSLDDIVFHLKEKIDQVPHFFNQAPIIIDISKMKRGITIDEFDVLIQSVSGARSWCDWLAL
ncbi:hypothetical protein AB8616_04330 [Marinomonas sp. RS-M-Aa-14]|uniref:hypothetical protein n=1 Tax=Marinomonas sp. RS-M-Aa-14 TaxID=3241169 RepID=UPI003AAC42EC